MSESWSPEVHIDEALVRALLVAAEPTLRDAPIRWIGSGWDNEVWRVGELVLRIPRREVAADLLQMEFKLLPWLSPRLPLPTPRPVFATTVPNFPWTAVAYHHLPGVEWVTVDVSPEQRGRAADELGAWMGALHALPPPRGIVGDVLGRGDWPRRAQMMRGRLPAVQDAGPAVARAAAFVAEHLDQVVPCSAPVLVHGDLYDRHVLLDGDRQVSGILDWGDAHRGDAAMDLSLAYGLFDGDDRARCLEAYGPVDEHTSMRARLRVCMHRISLLDYALKTGRRRLRDSAIRALLRAAA